MPIRILVVEDHEPTRELIREYLARDSQLEVVAETSDGAEAVTLARQLRPDIVLMDLLLPGMSGRKATLLVKKACPTADVIILTSYAFEDLKQLARETPDMVGCAAFLEKREIPTRLLGVIKSLRRDKRN
ncbi:MAG: response regulator transcription factor [Acidobacteria bacterium]|nr:response regulator transcription factor [Acidobacteriota bacterium]